MKTIQQIFTLVKKDAIAELRTKELFTSMFLFIFLSLAIFNFAFAGSEIGDDLFAGIVWVAFLFAAVLGLNRSFVHEKDKGCLEGLMLCPMDRSSIYFGKALGNLIFLLFVEIASLPIFSIFFNKNVFLKDPLFLLFILFVGSFGIASVGTLLSAITINTKARELLLPILLFPVIVPVLIGVVKLTKYLIVKDPFLNPAFWMKLLIVYDIIFLLVAFLTFEFVIEE